MKGGNDYSRQNIEFHCGEKKGDPFWIRKMPPTATDGGKERYGIGSGKCVLYMNGDSGNTKNGEVRCNKPISDTFYIEQDGPNPYQIGFISGSGTRLCPMVMNGVIPGNTIPYTGVHNAQFRCDQKTGNRFWIKQGRLLWKNLCMIIINGS